MCKSGKMARTLIHIHRNLTDFVLQLCDAGAVIVVAVRQKDLVHLK